MRIRSRYGRVTSVYGRVGVVVRHALREVRPPDPVARIDEQLRAVDAVRALPEPYRSAFFCCRIDGLSPAEAARRLGVPAAVMEARLREARRLLAARR